MNTAPPKEIFEFGSFVLDPAQRSLTGEAGREIPINPKAFDALVYLVQRAGTIVARSELHAALWPQTIVEENNLSQTIAAIRRALGDTEEQRFIATVPRRGYQFIAPVIRRAGPATTPPPRQSDFAPALRNRTYASIAVSIVGAAAILVGALMTRDRISSEHTTSATPGSGLTHETVNQLTQPPTESMVAYSSYLKGLALYRSSGGIGVSMSPLVRESIQRYFDEALAIDPKFALALAWRAQLRADSLQVDSFPISERAARIAELAPAIARDARDALAIDPSLGIAYAALTRLHFFDNRLDDALATLDDARKLAPDDPTIWQAAAILHCMRDEPDAAIAAARRAIELDPRSPGPYSLLSIGLRMTGHRDEAAAAAARMIEIAPTAALGYVALARVLTAEGDSPRIHETLRAAEQLLGDARNLRLDLALSYASIGAETDARRLVEEFRRSMTGMYVDPALEAMALLATREHAKALELLKSTVAQGRRGMDQMPLTLIRLNTWNDPVLETSDWLQLRKALAFDASTQSTPPPQ